MGYILLNTLLIIPETTKLELYPKNSRNEAIRNIHRGRQSLNTQKKTALKNERPSV